MKLKSVIKNNENIFIIICHKYDKYILCIYII
jgi:hypothetical protein